MTAPNRLPGCGIMFGVTISTAACPSPSSLTISRFVRICSTTETNKQYQFQWASILETELFRSTTEDTEHTERE
jgi:hypothetical protein